MKKKILLIDDIREFRTLLKVYLSKRYEVVTAENGLEALGLLESGVMPDVIVTDLLMPGLDGYQLISRLKMEKSFQHIPVIILSNVDKHKARQILPKKNIYGYITKNFRPDELMIGLENMLSNALSSVN